MKSINKFYIFGRWLGDGSKTTNTLEIAHDDNIMENQSMKKIADMLQTTLHHSKKGYTTSFHNQQDLLFDFKIMLMEINKGNFLNIPNDEMISLIAGFLDSDGSIEYHSPNEKTKFSSEKIKIVLYNNNENILNFIQSYFNKWGLITHLKESYHLTTNMGVIDNCWRLRITEVLSIYYLSNKIKKYLLHEEKKKRINKWIKSFDNFYLQKKLNFTEIFTSIEGEGRDIGVVKTFVRVKGCPHNCSFCDSCFSQGSKSMGFYKAPTLKETIDKIKKTGYIKHIELTGGSPDWYPQLIGYLLIYFKTHHDSKITMQVSGGIPTTKSFKLFKLSDLNSFDYKDLRENIPFVIEDELIREQDEIKFLIRDHKSYIFTREKINELSQRLNCQFVITTQTLNNEDNVDEKHIQDLRKLINKILKDDKFNKNKIRIFPRLHILTWKNKKGV